MIQKTLGPTGEYPEGKLNETDRGQLLLGVTVFNGNIIIDFGTPVTWIGMPPSDVLKLIEKLQDAVKKAES